LPEQVNTLLSLRSLAKTRPSLQKREIRFTGTVLLNASPVAGTHVWVRAESHKKAFDNGRLANPRLAADKYDLTFARQSSL